MNKKIIIGITTLALFGIIAVMAKNNGQQINVNSNSKTTNKTQDVNKQKEKDQENLPMSVAKISADKIEVVHFHGTHQCYSCITVGKYALKTIKEKFPEEYANGRIVFKDINGELPANRDIVMKYQARGSSLFVNAITDGKDKIEEDTRVWRLVNNESQFISYFENKLNKLLGK